MSQEEHDRHHEHLTIKVPVVLAKPKIQVNIDATITFPTPVLEIKNVKKRLKITQCRLLLPSNKLFLKGFVRKNFQFATPLFGTATTVFSNLQSFTTDIAFSHVEDLTGRFITPPEAIELNSQSEFEFFTSTPLPLGFPAKENLLAGDLTQFDQISQEFFNELPFCELVAASFIEFDEALNRTQGFFRTGSCCGTGGFVLPFEEGTFTMLEEKLVLEFVIKILQNQQVKVKERK